MTTHKAKLRKFGFIDQSLGRVGRLPAAAGSSAHAEPM